MTKRIGGRKRALYSAMEDIGRLDAGAWIADEVVVVAIEVERDPAAAPGADRGEPVAIELAKVGARDPRLGVVKAEPGGPAGVPVEGQSLAVRGIDLGAAARERASIRLSASGLALATVG